MCIRDSLQCFFRFWHIQNHVYFHLIFHGFWHAFGYILAHIFKTCSRIVFVYLFDDALRCLLDASGTPLGKLSTPGPPLGCLWAPILSCKTRLNRPLRPPWSFFVTFGGFLEASGTPLGSFWTPWAPLGWLWALILNWFVIDFICFLHTFSRLDNCIDFDLYFHAFRCHGRAKINVLYYSFTAYFVQVSAHSKAITRVTWKHKSQHWPSMIFPLAHQRMSQ